MDESEVFYLNLPSGLAFYSWLPSGQETFGTRFIGWGPEPAGSLAAQLLRGIPTPSHLAEVLRKQPKESGLNGDAARLLDRLSWCKAFVSASTRQQKLGKPRPKLSQAWDTAVDPVQEEARVIEALRNVQISPRLGGQLLFTLPDESADRRLEALAALSTVFGVRSGSLRACNKCDEGFLAERKQVRRCRRCRRRPQRVVGDPVALAGERKKIKRRLRWRLDQQVKAKTRTPEERIAVLKAVMRGFSRMTPDAVWRKWDMRTRKPRGRRPHTNPRTTTATKQEPRLTAEQVNRVLERDRRMVGRYLTAYRGCKRQAGGEGR